jgi:hypothetical protein
MIRLARNDKHWGPDPKRAQTGLDNGWVDMGHAVIRVFVVKLSEFLNRWRAGGLRAVTAELNEDIGI